MHPVTNRPHIPRLLPPPHPPRPNAQHPFRPAEGAEGEAVVQGGSGEVVSGLGAGGEFVLEPLCGAVEVGGVRCANGPCGRHVVGGRVARALPVDDGHGERGRRAVVVRDVHRFVHDAVRVRRADAGVVALREREHELAGHGRVRPGQEDGPGRASNSDGSRAAVQAAGGRFLREVTDEENAGIHFEGEFGERRQRFAEELVVPCREGRGYAGGDGVNDDEGRLTHPDEVRERAKVPRKLRRHDRLAPAQGRHVRVTAEQSDRPFGAARREEPRHDHRLVRVFVVDEQAVGKRLVVHGVVVSAPVRHRPLAADPGHQVDGQE